MPPASTEPESYPGDPEVEPVARPLGVARDVINVNDLDDVPGLALQAEARALGLSTSGSKAALAAAINDRRGHVAAVVVADQE